MWEWEAVLGGQLEGHDEPGPGADILDCQLASSDVVQKSVSCHDYFAHQLEDPCMKYGLDWEGAQKKMRSSGRGSLW